REGRDAGGGRGRRGGHGGRCPPRARPPAPGARPARTPAGALVSDAFPSDEGIGRPAPESEAELAFEGALRPRSLAEFVGQSKVRGQLQLLLDAAALQNRTPDHILLAGPPGLGKTTLAMI